MTLFQAQRRDLLLALVSGAAAANAAATDDSNVPPLPRPDAQALRTDLDILGRSFRDLHPGLTRYLSASAFDRGMADLQKAWLTTAGDDNPAPRVLTLSRLLGSLRCGHTYTNFFNQRGAVKDAICTAPPRLPLQFTWVGSRAVVTAAHASVVHRVPPGTELLGIDGRPMAAIRAALLPLVRADGHNLAAKLALLAPAGADELETFDVLYPLAFGDKPSFQLRLRERGLRGSLRSIEVAGIDHAERQRMSTAPHGEPSDATPPWPLTLRPDGTAVLTMPGWAMYRTKWDWKAYLARVFEQLQQEKVRGLVIDLRGNEGGLDCGDEILSRLIDAPLQADQYERLVRYRRTSEALNPYLDTWDDSFRDWGDQLVPASRPGYFAFRNNPINRIEPQGPRFQGRVAVLVDGSNHSATFRFVQLLRQARLGALVGSPTGGNQRGINGGAFFFLRLPGSGIEVDLPLIGTFARRPMPDAGLLPDVAVANSVADIQAARDAVLARALKVVTSP